ncbi:MAG: sugar phosphate isomerase/epimerase [Ruminococcus sp.]|nr:sugar phosphate isomerase/epimerase [Ruminococcus sp.]
MQAAVSTACLYPAPTEEALYDLAVNGVQSAEIFLNTHSELTKSFAHESAAILRQFDMKCCAVHPFTSELEQLMFFSDYERRLSDSLDFYKHYFQFMNIVGAKIFVFHAAKAVRNTELFCERYSRLYNTGREFGISVAVENVARCKSGSSAFIREISGLLGSDFAFVLDTKQAIRSGETPFAFLSAAGSSVRHVHISDSGELGDCLLVGRGSFRFKQFFEILAKNSPECSVVLEVYRSAFGGISELISSYGTLCSLTEKYGRRNEAE